MASLCVFFMGLRESGSYVFLKVWTMPGFLARFWARSLSSRYLLFSIPMLPLLYFQVLCRYHWFFSTSALIVTSLFGFILKVFRPCKSTLDCASRDINLVRSRWISGLHKMQWREYFGFQCTEAHDNRSHLVKNDPFRCATPNWQLDRRAGEVFLVLAHFLSLWSVWLWLFPQGASVGGTCAGTQPQANWLSQRKRKTEKNNYLKPNSQAQK